MTTSRPTELNKRKEAQLSVRRETALQCESVVGKTGRQYSADNIGLSSTTVTE